MPTRNGGNARSLRADIAVLNPETGKMEFPSASKRKPESLSNTSDYRGWKDHLNKLDEMISSRAFDPNLELTPAVIAELTEIMPNLFSNNGGEELTPREHLEEYKAYLLKERATAAKIIEDDQKPDAYSKRDLYVLGMEKTSPERKAELDKLRNESEVKEIIYRGQDAYEVLDSKKAAEVIKKKRAEDRAVGGEHYTKGVGYTGSEGDGYYHLTPEGSYATAYGGYVGVEGPKHAVIEGVLIAKKVLDITSLTADQNTRLAKNNTEYWDKYSKYFGSPPHWQGWDISGALAKYKHDESSRAKDWATEIVKAVADQYEKKNGKRMPANAGLKGEAKNETDPNGSYDRLVSTLRKDLSSRGDTTYQVLKTPTFKKLVKDGGFDAIKYKDYGKSFVQPDGTVAYAATKPTQFKSYFGNKKVNQDSPNVFDAD